MKQCNRFEYLTRLLPSIRQHELVVDSNIVFSSETEKKNFGDNFVFGFYHGHGTCGSCFQLSSSSTVYLHVLDSEYHAHLNTSAVMTKKFWLVFQLINRYEYFIVCDAEVEVVNHVDVFQTIHLIFEQRKIFASQYVGFDEKNQRPGMHGTRMETAMKRFRPNEKITLMDITKNFSLYSWWNEIPIMERKSAHQFLTDENLGILNKSRIESGEFDMLVYQYYLILNYNWSFIDVSEHQPSKCWNFCHEGLGECGGGCMDAVTLIRPHWALQHQWKNKQDKYSGCDIFLTFHCDRKTTNYIDVD
jgi:hypothetical protein